MEEVFLRFPYLAENIFKKLGNQGLSKCCEVGQSWKTFIDYYNLMWIRIKKKYPLQNKDKAHFATIKNCEKYGAHYYCTTDLQLAALTGQTEIFKILFEEQFKYKNKLEKRWEGYEMTPFILAASKGRLEVCKVIVEKIRNPARKEKYPREILKDKLKMKEVWNEILSKIQLMKNLVHQSLEAFDVACQNKQTKVAGFLFENASILKLSLAKCFTHSVQRGNTYMAEFIIDNAVETDFDLNQILQYACRVNGKREIEIMRLLIGRMDIEKIDANTLFQMASEKGLVGLAKAEDIFLENPALISKINLNLKNDDGHSAFHNFCRNGRTGFAEYLIENSKELEIDLNAQDNQGMTGFHLACKYYMPYTGEYQARLQGKPSKCI